jgi:hypothetical protein
VPDYSAYGTNFHLIDCSDDIVVDAEGTASGTTAEADVGSAVDIPEGDSA